jgi:hypothetical protein
MRKGQGCRGDGHGEDGNDALHICWLFVRVIACVVSYDGGVERKESRATLVVRQESTAKLNDGNSCLAKLNVSLK